MINWNKWKSFPTVKLWQAVALVMNLDPDRIRLRPMASPGRPIFDPYSFAGQSALRDFNDALRSAEESAGVSGQPIAINGSQGLHLAKCSMNVALGDVVKFFAKCQWPPVPAELSCLREAVIPATDKADDPSAPTSQVTAEREETELDPVSGALTVCGFTSAEEDAVPGPTAHAGPIVTHALKRRSDPLAAVLNLAEQQAVDAADWPSVWAALVALAVKPSPPPPLLGYIEGEGVQYRVDNAEQPTDYLTREAFRGRFRRKR